VSDKLQKLIQTGGGKTGHSSVEDAAATLDLVRWWVVNEKTKRAAPAKNPSSTLPSGAAKMRR
jgi:RNA exonuclease 1